MFTTTMQSIIIPIFTDAKSKLLFRKVDLLKDSQVVRSRISLTQQNPGSFLIILIEFLSTAPPLQRLKNKNI